LGRLRVSLAVVLMTSVVGVRAVPQGAGSDSRVRRENRWLAGRPVAIKTTAGLARFVVPTPSAGSRTLVIVSALSRSGGPFPIRVSARQVDPKRVAAPSIEDEGPRRPPALSPQPLAPVAAPVNTQPPRKRGFQLMVRDGDVASASNYLAVNGTLRAVGRRVQVYVDDHDLEVVKPAVLEALVATFDDRVFPLAARSFGQARDVDGDGRFTILMSSWLTRLAGGRLAVDGFVRGADLDLDLAAPFSNHCDMMYLSTSLEPGPHLQTVLAHEYTHAVTFSAKAMSSGIVATEEEGWLDEALAHLVEDLHGFSRSNLDYRVSAFLSEPERYRLVVDDYYASGLFRSHGNRGGTYLFLRWCADRFGPALLPSLIRSPRQGVANLEAATGTSFADLYRAWSIALFMTGFDPSRPHAPEFRSLNVRGPFDDWELAGPRTSSVTPGGPDASWSSAATASRYVIVTSSPTGAAEVTVTAPSEAGLQVTAVPLPDDLARVELSVRPIAGPDGEPSFRAELRERNGTSVRLSALAWEPLVPGPDPHAPGLFRRAGLDALGIASAFGSSSLPAQGRLVSRPIAWSGALEGEGRALVVKAVGTDARGRRVAAWAVVPALDGSGVPPDSTNSN
jgi:hypothetical protein